MTGRVAIIGAGAVGGFIAMELASVGVDVVVIDPFIDAATCDWSRAVRHDGREVVPMHPPRLARSYDELRSVELCIVAVKSRHTRDVAAALATRLTPTATVISLQNGLGNASLLQAALGKRVAAGVVMFNARIDETGRRRQTSAGAVLIERMDGPHRTRQRALCSRLGDAGQQAALRGDFANILAGKLVLNLNNGVCAATGLTIRASLADRDARRCYALCIGEAISIMHQAGLSPRRVTVLPPAWLGAVLRLPDFAIGRLAPRLGHIELDARSSTLQDLDCGRITEIDELNGAIVSMARRVGRAAPINEAVTRIVHEHERATAGGARPHFLSPAQLRREIELATRLAGQPSRAMLTENRRMQ